MSPKIINEQLEARALFIQLLQLEQPRETILELRLASLEEFRGFIAKSLLGWEFRDTILTENNVGNEVIIELKQS